MIEAKLSQRSDNGRAVMMTKPQWWRSRDVSSLYSLALRTFLSLIASSTPIKSIGLRRPPSPFPSAASPPSPFPSTATHPLPLHRDPPCSFQNSAATRLSIKGEACIVYLPKFEAGTHQGGRGKGGLLDFAHRLRVTFVRRIKGGTYKTKNPNAHVCAMHAQYSCECVIRGVDTYWSCDAWVRTSCRTGGGTSRLHGRARPSTASPAREPIPVIVILHLSASRGAKRKWWGRVLPCSRIQGSPTTPIRTIAPGHILLPAPNGEDRMNSSAGFEDASAYGGSVSPTKESPSCSKLDAEKPYSSSNRV
ncbi:hypothetical protein JHK87_024661 [Glycine soja]|nr:hypothetical protein JHK87_024661 [Glycine soja]